MILLRLFTKKNIHYVRYCSFLGQWALLDEMELTLTAEVPIHQPATTNAKKHDAWTLWDD